MTKSIERVEQDLTQLRQASSQLGKELSATYDNYFASLAPTLKQQAVQACFYLCTTCYPEAFLKLSYDRRSQLLATLQRVISNVIASLATRIDSNANQNNNDDEDEVTGELTSMPVMPIDWFATPASLADWRQNIEDEIGHTISEISYKANLLLQQVQIIPHSIPKPILEAHPEVERQGGNNTNVPNILSILIDREERGKRQLEERELVTGPLESPRSDRSEELSIVPIHSIFLRLSEVEFSNMEVLNLRKDIERAANKINTLQREYIQKQQELKIAEAESAWRNSWFEN